MQRASRTGRHRTRHTLVAVGLVGALFVAAAAGTDGVSNAQDTGEPAPFVDVPATAVDQARDAADAPVGAGPARSRPLGLNREAMAAVLSRAPSDRDVAELILTLPAPDGSMARFTVWENNVMAPELAAELPEITTYSGQGVDDGAATIAFDLSPLGFHAQVLSPEGNWYIDPVVLGDDVIHESFYRDDLGPGPARFVEAHDDELAESAVARSEPAASRSAGTQLRTHRLAVAATSGYTAQFPSLTAAQTEIVSTINDVNAIYEKELAISLQLVTNNNELVYESTSGVDCAGPTLTIDEMTGGAGTGEITVETIGIHGLAVDDVVELSGTTALDGTWAVRSTPDLDQFVLRGSFFATGSNFGTVREWFPDEGKDCDPFNNSNADIDVNQAVVDQVIGDSFYDVGHVFTTTGGGIAQLGAAGISDLKARGLTGLPFQFQLQSDEFAVDFVAHELGHQYGGSHTFNGVGGNCVGGNWGGAANSFEPGSGSTIQAYAGICGTDNLQNGGDGTQEGDGTNASDPYFHSRSFEQIQTHLDTIPSAGNTTPTGNTPPTVDAGPSIIIPTQTPFFLRATGSDVNGDTLTYHFEQRNEGSHEALNAPALALGVGPLFRSFPPTTNPTSFFPRLADLVDGSTNQNTSCPTLTGFDRNAADCWSQFLIQTSGPNSIPFAAERELQFLATVRDNRTGGGGVNSDDTIVVVHNTGSRFRVISPNGGGSVAGPTTVTWDPASTTAVPINAATVSIRLSTDGGLTYPTALATNVANDGSQSVTMPNAAHADARVMVHSGSYTGGSGFFDISDGDFATNVYLPTPPSAPIAPMADPGDLQATVSWSPPSSDGGSPIISYDVTSTPGAMTCSTTGATTCTVGGLTNGTSYTFAVTATNAIGTGPAASTPAVVPREFITVRQARLEDTRPTGKIGDKTNGGAPLMFNVLGRAGVPGSGVKAVSLNVTVDRGEQPFVGGGFATVWDCAGSPPTASNLNFHNGLPIANAVVTPVSVSPEGNVCIFVYGKADLLVDINGYFPASSGFEDVRQQRLVDTRPGKVGDKTNGATPFKFNVYDHPGVLPTSGIESVSLNVTVDQGEQPFVGGGFATVWDCVGAPPTASNLNFHDGKPVPNAVITKVAANGDVCIFVYGRASLLVDVNGYFPTGSDFTTVRQTRLEDTRPTGKIGNGTNGAAPFEFNVYDHPGVLPTSGIDAVSLNLTIDRGEQPAIGGGFATVWDCAGSAPTASNLNFHNGLPVPNAVITPVGPGGEVCVFIYGRADILVDVNGYFPD